MTAPLVEDGLRRAKFVQQAVVAKATMVMEKEMMTYHGSSRYLVRVSTVIIDPLTTENQMFVCRCGCRGISLHCAGVYV